MLLSSHILAEVEALGDRVSIIRDGRTVESGTLDELRHLTRTTISVQSVVPITGLANLTGVHNARVSDTRATFDVSSADLDRVLSHLVQFGVRALTSTPPTLEELFLRHYADRPAERLTAGVR